MAYTFVNDFQFDDDIFIADGAKFMGKITLKKGVNVWFNAVLRADVAEIIIGENTNIQDNATVHVDYDKSCVVGNHVTVGHGAVLHACEIGDGTLVGMNAVVLSYAKIGKNCLIAAGSVVPEGMEIPDNSMVAGIPAKVKKELSPEMITSMNFNNNEYVKIAKRAKEITHK